MKIEKINEEKYLSFVSSSDKSSIYQSLEWKKFKENEGKDAELLGIYQEEMLVGVSLVIYTNVLKGFKMAYASRGFIYDYSDIKEFKKAIIGYFKTKKVIFFRMDPLIILNEYNRDLVKTNHDSANDIINKLKDEGFIHFGFNTGYEATQFRFIHRLAIDGEFEALKKNMNKSTKKNMELALFRGLKIREVTKDDLDLVLSFFDKSSERKNFNSLSKNFYLNLLSCFNDNIKMYIAYIDKEEYLSNLKTKLNELDRGLVELINEMEKENVGDKLKNKEKLYNEQIIKYQTELKEARELEDTTDISAILTISKYSEVVAFASGMNNKYRKFNPKYLMYPTIIKDAINGNFKYVNFLGVKNILDKNDSDYGVYEVKRGFGGQTLEYIGEFDLPINEFLYKVYKFLERK